MDEAVNYKHWLSDENMLGDFQCASQWPKGELQPEDKDGYVIMIIVYV